MSWLVVIFKIGNLQQLHFFDVFNLDAGLVFNYSHLTHIILYYVRENIRVKQHHRRIYRDEPHNVSLRCAILELLFYNILLILQVLQVFDDFLLDLTRIYLNNVISFWLINIRQIYNHSWNQTDIAANLIYRLDFSRIYVEF